MARKSNEAPKEPEDVINEAPKEPALEQVDLDAETDGETYLTGIQAIVQARIAARGRK